jgi:hypothetical protein
MWKLTPLAAITLIGLIVFNCSGSVADAIDFYPSDISILEDPGEHGPFIGMPDKLELKVQILEPGSILIEGPEPWVNVIGTIEDGQIFAQGEGTVAGFESIVVLFQGAVSGEGLQGQYTMGADGGLPGRLPIVYLVEPQPPPNTYSITVLKLNDDTNQPIPLWEMNLFQGPDCSGVPLASAATDSDGFVDFTGLPPGTYSVSEKPETGWNPVTAPCQAVEVGGAASGAGDFTPCPIDDLDFPLPGCDEFDSGAQVNVEINLTGDTDTLTLNGPTVIQRSAVGDADQDGLDDVQTEIVQLDLTGTSSLLGPVEVRLSPDQPSLGAFEEQENEVRGEMDFAADSFFDVFFEIALPERALVLHNQEPFRIECKIEEIPPLLCLYQPPVPDPIELVNEDGIKIATLVHGVHIPLPPKEVLIVFRNEPKAEDTPTPTPTWKPRTITVLKVNDNTNQPLPGWKMNLFIGPDCSGSPVDSATTDAQGLASFTGLAPMVYSILEKPQPGWNPVGDDCQTVDVSIAGSGGAGVFADCPIDDLDFPVPGCDEFDSGAQVNVEINLTGDSSAVTLNGPTVVQRGPVGDADQDGLDDVQTEIVQLDLTGTSSLLGPVEVRLSPDTPSLGAFEDQENDIPGAIDFPADSFFDVFFEIALPERALTLHNEDPFRIECKIEGIPPLGCFYQPPVPDPIELFNDDGLKIATIVHGLHVPLPPNEVLIVFRNAPKEGTPTATATPTPAQFGTPTATPTPAQFGTPTATPTPAPANNGDVNKNGTTNSIDASLILQLEAGIIAALDHPENADTNQNGVINSIDATLILQLEAGLIPGLPV